MLYAVVTILLTGLVAADCNADNCLRALRASQTPNRLQAAQEFCATFTQQSVAATAIPTFAAEACVQNQDGPLSMRISSACNCIVAPTRSSRNSSATVSSTTSTPPPTTIGACAIVSASSSVQKLVSPAATPTVAAQLAYDCLNSVPLNKTAALQLVDAIEPYLEWQTDSAYLKAPPATYFYPPHDIFAYLASVKANLQSDKYANEYQFQADLYQVFARAHDGHFVFYPDALTKAFEFGRQLALVSVSEDGTSLPVIKIYQDVLQSPSTASVLTQINGIDASTYVQEFAYTASFNQDADAAYNTMFFEKAFIAGGTGTGYFSISGRVRYIYPGANTTFTFANGTSTTLNNIAYVKGGFFGVTDGLSFYRAFCTGPEGSEAAAHAATSDDTNNVAAGAPGYPPNFITTNDNIVSGYYLNGSGYEDVVVMSVLAFESESIAEFQDIAQALIARALKDGKTKLVIDLSANGGGYILQGYDLFRQLFPTIVQDGYTRWRENDVFLTTSKIYSANSAKFDPYTSSNNAIINEYESSFSYEYDLNITNQPFLTFADKFAPHVYQGDNFTNIMRWNLNDPLTTTNGTYGLGIEMTGYGSRANFTQPFKAENIIMLMDGYCASTCTLFSEFMRTQAGVKVIAMGGRPKAGPIQAVGGIKGAEVLAWGDIYSAARTALPNATPDQASILERLTLLPVDRSSSSGVNVRDNILPDHVNDGVPAQFVFEEADCRLYYTEPMVTDVSVMWKAAADAAFNGKSCAYGSLPKRSVEPKSTSSAGRVSTQRLAERSGFEKRAVQDRAAPWLAKHLQKAIP